MTNVDPFPYPFDEVQSGVTNAAGALTLTFAPNFQVNWSVEQVSARMPAAPAGAQLNVTHNGVIVAPAFSARRVGMDGSPVFLRPGDRLAVEWTNCGAGVAGEARISYRKVPFGRA